MSELELKEKELNKLKQESDQLVLNQHPASDKIEVSQTYVIELAPVVTMWENFSVEVHKRNAAFGPEKDLLAKNRVPFYPVV